MVFRVMDIFFVNPSSSSPMASLNPIPSATQNFPNSIAEKLDDSNYLHQRKQIEPVIKSHKFQQFVVNPTIPPRFLTDEECDAENGNPKYEAWEVQD